MEQRLLHQQFAECRDQSYRSHYHDDSGQDAVDEPHGAEVEMTAHFVDKPCDAKPPQHCSGKYRHISGHIMIGLKLGSKEAEPGEESDNKEKVSEDWRM